MPGRVVELFQQPFGVALSARRMVLVEAEAFNLLIERRGLRVCYAPQECIFRENDPAESIYKVVSGLVCTCKSLSNGRRQIVGFYLSGEYFGLECSGTHTLPAEAITNAQVRVIKKGVLAALSNRDAVERQLLSLTTLEIGRLQERVLLLAKNAQKRVGEFILEMEKRTKVGTGIQLPMSRQDIVDYLGLTIETVSRILTSLESCAVIELLGLHQIVLGSHSALRTAMEDHSKGAIYRQHIASPSKKTSNK